MKLPYKQGDLDGLCGLYAIINSFEHILGYSDVPRSVSALSKMLAEMRKQRPNGRFFVNGTTAKDIERLLAVMTVDKPISWSRPLKAQIVTLDSFWSYSRTFFEQKKGTIIMDVMQNTEFDHWTVAHRITDHNLILKDSDELIRLSHKQCFTRLNEETGNTYINTANCFFLWLEQGATNE